MGCIEGVYGHLRIPMSNFIIPSEDPWPKETWGVSLSQRTVNLRSMCDILSQEHIVKLNEIGFISTFWISIGMTRLSQH